jgi:hypothetical protein
MFLRITQKISKKDMARISKAKKSMDGLLGVMTGEFLAEGLNFPIEKKPLNGAFPCEILTKKRIGFEPSPKCYPYLNYEQEVAFGRSLNTGGDESQKEVTFALKINTACKNKGKTDVLLEIEGKRNIEISFWFGSARSLYESKKNMFDFIAYFYNRELLYARISEILKENKEEILELTNKTFFKDLVCLFAAKPGNNVKNFTLDKNFRQKQIFSEEQIGKTARKTKLGNFESKSKDVDIIELSLTAENSLNVDFSFPEQVTILEMMGGASKYLTVPEEALGDAFFEKFIKENLNLWLKNYIALTNFGVALYKKLKTKILINSI